MRDPIIDQLAALGEDADRVILADPADLRRAGTRRTRLRVLATAVVVLAVIGGAAVGFRPSGQALPPLPSVPSPSVYPTSAAPSPSPSEPAQPSIDMSTVLHSGVCSGALATCFPPGVPYYTEFLPAPCTAMSHPSEAKRVSRLANSLGLQTPSDRIGDAQLTYGQAGVTVTTYRDGGAGGYLAEVRSALAACPSVQRARSLSDKGLITLRYRLVSSGQLGGDDSLLIARRYQTANNGEQEFLIAVTRFGDKVLVAVDHGWLASPRPGPSSTRFATST